MNIYQLLAISINIFGLLGILFTVARAGLKIGLILNEVSPNGGHSLKDRIVKLEANSAEVRESLTRIEEKTDQQNVLLGRLESGMDTAKKDAEAAIKASEEIKNKLFKVMET